MSRWPHCANNKNKLLSPHPGRQGEHKVFLSDSNSKFLGREKKGWGETVILYFFEKMENADLAMAANFNFRTLLHKAIFVF